MEQRLKKILNEKMDKLPLVEVMPDFDKAANWVELSSHLTHEKQKAQPMIGRWVYAAAALVAGLFIGGFAVKYSHRGIIHLPKGTTVVNAVQDNYRPIKDRRDTVMQPASHAPAVTSKQSSRVSAIKAFYRQSAIPKNDMAASKKEPERAVKQQIQHEVQAPIRITAEATIKPHQEIRAIHLLDVESEDRMVLVNDAKKAHFGTSFTFYISPRRLPSGRDAYAPSSVLEPIIR